MLLSPVRQQVFLSSVHNVQRRWRSLRTCFVREIGHQKQESQNREDNIPVKKRKVYSFFRYMKFLLPSGDENYNDYVNDCDTEASEDGSDESNSGSGSSESEEDTEDTEETEDSEESEEEYKKKRAKNVKQAKQKQIKQVKKKPIKQVKKEKVNDAPQQTQIKQYQAIISNQNEVEADEDKHFVLSLLPAFKKLNDNQRFDARIEILKVMRDYSNDGNSANTVDMLAPPVHFEHHSFTPLGEASSVLQ